MSTSLLFATLTSDNIPGHDPDISQSTQSPSSSTSSKSHGSARNDTPAYQTNSAGDRRIRKCQCPYCYCELQSVYSICTQVRISNPEITLHQADPGAVQVAQQTQRASPLLRCLGRPIRRRDLCLTRDMARHLTLAEKVPDSAVHHADLVYIYEQHGCVQRPQPSPR